MGRQLYNIVSGLGSDLSVEIFGITANENATQIMDIIENKKRHPSQMKRLLSQINNVADGAYGEAVAGVDASAGSLLNGDVYSISSVSITSSYNVFAVYT